MSASFPVENALPTGDLGQLTPGQANLSKALAYYVSGLLHLSKGETNEFLEDWEKVVQLDPTREELREKLANEYFRRKDFKKMAGVLELSVKQSPKSVPYWTLLAVAYRADRQWAPARKAAERAIALDASLFPPYEVLFEVEIELQEPAKARKVLDRAARHKSGDYNYWIRLADLYVAIGAREPTLAVQKEQVVSYYERAATLQPDDPNVLTKVADFYLVSENLPKAIELYLKVLEKQPQAETVRYKLATCYVSQGNRQKGAEMLEQIAQLHPFNHQTFFLLGELYEEMKNSPKALANYQLSLSANPNQLVPHLKIVLLEMRSKNTESALKQLAIAAEKFPNTPQVSYFYGLVYCETKNFPRAVECFTEAARLASTSAPDMTDAVFHFYFGSALERNGQFDSAVAEFMKAMDLNPDYADAFNYLGFMYADRGIKLEAAVDLIEKALTYEPENGAFLDSLGWAYFKLNKLEDAMSYLQRASKVIGDDAVIHEHLADVYRKMGKTTEALLEYQKASELDPANKDVTEKLEGLRQSVSSTTPVTGSSSR